jgi:hypothetical protein
MFIGSGVIGSVALVFYGVLSQDLHEIGHHWINLQYQIVTNYENITKITKVLTISCDHSGPI